MIKLLVISDTHGDTSLAEKVLEKHQDADIVVHLGDYLRDAERLHELYPEIRFEVVCGNCDYVGGDIPMEKLLELEGQRVLLTHGHRYSVKWGIERLRAKAHYENIQLLLFGHTHICHTEYGPGYILLNPGSISEPRGSNKGTYAVVLIDNAKINIELMSQ